jgi:hypothetical protein
VASSSLSDAAPTKNRKRKLTARNDLLSKFQRKHSIHLFDNYVIGPRKPRSHQLSANGSALFCNESEATSRPTKSTDLDKISEEKFRQTFRKFALDLSF